MTTRYEPTRTKMKITLTGDGGSIPSEAMTGAIAGVKIQTPFWSVAFNATAPVEIGEVLFSATLRQSFVVAKLGCGNVFTGLAVAE